MLKIQEVSCRNCLESCCAIPVPILKTERIVEIKLSRMLQSAIEGNIFLVVCKATKRIKPYKNESTYSLALEFLSNARPA